MATSSSTMQDALETLGVRPDTLSQQEKDQLDNEGFLPVSGVLTPGHLGSLRARVDELRRLRSVPCFDCGGRFPALVMEFDHRDSGTKRARVTHIPGRASDRRILAEVQKCDIVCSNRHRHRTFVRRQQYDAGVAQSGLERLPSK